MSKGIYVCAGGSCKALGSLELLDELKRIVKEKNVDIDVKIHTKRTGCHGLCEVGPLVLIKPDELLYVKVKKIDCEEIVNSVIKGTVVDHLLFEGNRHVDDIPFYKNQLELFPPGKIDSYPRCGILILHLEQDPTPLIHPY